MRANDEATQEHIAEIEADNDALRVELELVTKDRDQWKAFAMVMQSDRDCLVA